MKPSCPHNSFRIAEPPSLIQINYSLVKFTTVMVIHPSHISTIDSKWSPKLARAHLVRCLRCAPMRMDTCTLSSDQWKMFAEKCIDRFVFYEAKLWPCYWNVFCFPISQERLLEVRRHEQLSDNEHCIKMYRAWEEDSCLYMQLELCKSNLEDYLLEQKFIPESRIWSIILDMLLVWIADFLFKFYFTNLFGWCL